MWHFVWELCQTVGIFLLVWIVIIASEDYINHKMSEHLFYCHQKDTYKEEYDEEEDAEEKDDVVQGESVGVDREWGTDSLDREQVASSPRE